ncbi:EpsG family protein [Carnobacterium mobile]|uniref:EpsG family protein n=1 Tax=Carnobacterium mobile TaxID=2750 RepID=UPI000553E979|nr:EpsG family protein [Carnobacterium mobile]
MSLYFFVLIILTILALTEVLLREKKISFITISVMSLMAGLRFFTGYDFISYKNFFEKIDNVSDVFNGSIDAEKGYLFLNFIFSKLELNFYFFILVFSLLSIGLLGYFVYKHTPFPSLFLMYYYARFFLVRDMGQIRSSLACIILLYAIPFMIKKKPAPFLLIVFLASLFHITAWFFIVVYLFNIIFEKLTTKTVIGLLILSTIIGLVIQIPQLYTWAIPDRYIAYFTSPSYTDGSWIMNPVLWMQVGIFFGVFYLCIQSNLEEQKFIEGMLKVYLLSSLILISAGTLGTVGGRISTLFSTSEVFLVPYLFMNLTRNKLSNLLLYFAFTFFILCLIFVVSGTYTEYIPYQTIFSF